MADIAIAFPQSALRIPYQASFSPARCSAPPPEISILSPQKRNLRHEHDGERLDIWSAIQYQKQENSAPLATYIHPLVLRSSILMSQKSLEVCTESLGSETGSDGFSSGDEFDFISSPAAEAEEEIQEEETIDDEAEEMIQKNKQQLISVNYHCSTGRRSPARSFPPPLPSISGDGLCLKMRSHRLNGRLVIEAVSAPSQTYLHSERRDGRLLLSIVNSTNTSPPIALCDETEAEEEDEVVEEEEEEVEVVDRGTVVEVKVTGLAAFRVHRSSLVINKFVVGSQVTAADVKLSATTTTTAASAAVAASSISLPASTSEGFCYNYLHHHCDAPESKLLFASRRLRREELLHDMRRCNELRRPLFIFEQPHCIATSS